MIVTRFSLDVLPRSSVAPLIGDSLFGSFGFAELWKTVGGKAVYWVGEEQGEVIAVLPGVEFGISPVKRFYSMPDGCYGRLFIKNNCGLEPEVVAGCFMEALADAGYVKAYLFDFWGMFTRSEHFVAEKRETLLVKIPSSDWLPEHPQLRQQVRSAERQNIRIERFNDDLHFSRFMALKVTVEKRRGQRSRYPPSFFKSLARLAETDRRVQWVWCEHEGQAAASHVYLIEGDMLLYWLPYSDRTFSFLRPDQYMLYATVKRLWHDGVRVLNLGTSPPQAHGLIRYKEKWGGKPHVYNCYIYRSLLGRLV
jgi:hypothetical protein